MRILITLFALLFMVGCKGFQGGAKDATQSACDFVKNVCEMVPKAIGGEENSTPSPEPPHDTESQPE